MPNSRRLSRPSPDTMPPIVASQQARIEKKRDRLYSEVMMLREMQGVSRQATETARLLLTAQWIKADWRARERLVKAAEWMLRVGSLRVATSAI